jgi:hypothetical protein
MVASMLQHDLHHKETYMSKLVGIETDQLACVPGGSGPDLRFLTRAERSCTNSLSKVAQAKGLSDADIAARCLPAKKRERYVNAIQNWEDKIDP